MCDFEFPEAYFGNGTTSWSGCPQLAQLKQSRFASSSLYARDFARSSDLNPLLFPTISPLVRILLFCKSGRITNDILNIHLSSFGAMMMMMMGHLSICQRIQAQVKDLQCEAPHDILGILTFPFGLIICGTVFKKKGQLKEMVKDQ